MQKIKEEMVRFGGPSNCWVREISVQTNDGRIWLAFENPVGKWCFSAITDGKRSMTAEEEKLLYTRNSPLRREFETAAGIKLGYYHW